MKRRANIASLSDSETASKKPKKASDSPSQLNSPMRRAHLRECNYDKGEKIIGFYGGWPYVGSVSEVALVRMSFGSTYILLIRWNGFSGKNATSWISEFDVMKHNQNGLKVKEEMEQMQKDLIRKAGGKVDKVKQKKIFLKVVSEIRGNRLSPLRPMTSPYPDEWQTIIRMFALPKILVEHLKHTETLINERKVLLTKEGLEPASQFLTVWTDDDPVKQKYCSTLKELFNKFLFRILLYRCELPVFTRLVLESCEEGDYSKVVPVEYLLRLLSVLPELVTAACQGCLGKGGDNETIKSLLELANAHQSFLAYLETNVEALLRAPLRHATLDEPLEDEIAAEPAGKDSKEERILDPETEMQSSTTSGSGRKYMNKRKLAFPAYKFPNDENAKSSIFNMSENV